MNYFPFLWLINIKRCWRGFRRPRRTQVWMCLHSLLLKTQLWPIAGLHHCAPAVISRSNAFITFDKSVSKDKSVSEEAKHGHPFVLLCHRDEFYASFSINKTTQVFLFLSLKKKTTITTGTHAAVVMFRGLNYKQCSFLDNGLNYFSVI